jgi:hypothetical protein
MRPNPRYACREVGCHYSATQRVHLKTHMLTHCPGEVFSCPEGACGYRSNRKEHLTRHLRLVHGLGKAEHARTHAARKVRQPAKDQTLPADFGMKQKKPPRERGPARSATEAPLINGRKSGMPDTSGVRTKRHCMGIGFALVAVVQVGLGLGCPFSPRTRGDSLSTAMTCARRGEGALIRPTILPRSSPP